MICLVLLHKRLLDVALQNGLVIEPEVGGQELHVTAGVLLHPLPLLVLRADIGHPLRVNAAGIFPPLV